jgi:hypothetical protein
MSGEIPTPRITPKTPSPQLSMVVEVVPFGIQSVSKLFFFQGINVEDSLKLVNSNYPGLFKERNILCDHVLMCDSNIVLMVLHRFSTVFTKSLKCIKRCLEQRTRTLSMYVYIPYKTVIMYEMNTECVVGNLSFHFHLHH